MIPGPPPGLAPEEIIRLEEDAVVVLDQRLLPSEVAELRLTTWEDVGEAIRDMAVRGAPAIGVAGAMGVALAAARGPDELEARRAETARAAASLRAARPTAVNLAWAVDALAARAHAHPGPS